MILHSIQIEGWRCFFTPVNVGPFIAGLNIVHGPNGIGKSTLMLALTRGLFDSHNVGGADIKTLRPWGRQLAPKVTIEFNQNGERFQLHKQFLDSAAAKLSRQENGQFVPIAESRAADEQAREILGGEASARGTSDQRHWGLAQILWATQGSLEIAHLAPQTQATIQDALGSQIAAAGAEILEQKIAEAYGQFYTATGRLKSGASAPAIVGLESELEKAKENRTRRQMRLQEFDTASRRIEDLRRQTESARRNELELDGRLEKMRAQVQAFQKLVGLQKQYQNESKAARESYNNLAQRVESIRTASQERQQITNRLKQLTDDVPTQEKLAVQYREEEKNAETGLKEIRKKRSDVGAARQLAQLAERYCRNQQKQIDLEKQLKQIDATVAEVSRLRKSRDPIVAPDDKTLKKIVKIARQRDDIRLKLDAALITVSIQLESDTTIEITSAEKTGPQAIAKNDTIEVKGAPDVAFDLPGVGKFQATGPTDDFQELRGQWESAVSAFDELTAGFGTTDIGALEKLTGRGQELDRQIDHADVKLNTLLNGNDIEKLRNDCSRAENTLTEIGRDNREWKEIPPVPAELTRLADETEQKIDAEIENAELKAERARNVSQSNSQKLAEHKSAISNQQSLADSLEQRLESLRNDGLQDTQRSEKLAELALEIDVAKGKLAKVETEIRGLDGDPVKSLDMLQHQQKSFRNEAGDAEKKLHTESGRLQQIISEAPYSSLAAAEEQIAGLEQKIARQRLQIDAIALLHETVVQQKSNVMQSLLDPIRLRANIILQRISGSHFDSVQFDETLLPTGINPQSNSDSVALDQISGGEQEQVHFAVRMALAEVAFPNDRQLVVLDDVFTYTDASRLARIATILEEAAERFQIVLLTCHPERYRGLSHAKFFDLESIANGNA